MNNEIYDDGNTCLVTPSTGQTVETVQTGPLEEDIFGNIIGGDHNELELDIRTDIKKNENCVNNVNIIDGGSRVDSDIETGVVDDQSMKEMNIIEDLECTFKRGVCVKHKLKRKKMTLKC